MIMASGLLLLAALNAAKAIQDLNKETQGHGHWKKATPDEKKEVEEAIANMVATYASQVN